MAWPPVRVVDFSPHPYDGVPMLLAIPLIRSRFLGAMKHALGGAEDHTHR